jgi:hypothetical protein
MRSLDTIDTGIPCTAGIFTQYQYESAIIPRATCMVVVVDTVLYCVPVVGILPLNSLTPGTVLCVSAALPYPTVLHCISILHIPVPGVVL